MNNLTTLKKLETLLNKRSRHHLQHTFQERLQQNLAYFKLVSPEIYQDYQDYQPQTLRLEYNEIQHVNLKNIKLDNYVYPEDPITFTEKQIAQFLKHPNQLTFNLRHAKKGNYFFQDHYTNQIIDVSQAKELSPDSKDNDLPYEILLIMGVGLGYHIEKLVEKKDIKHLVIIEPSTDCFYASLHVIDWQQVIKKFLKPDHAIHFFIAKTPQTIVNNLAGILQQTGMFAASRLFIFHHTNSEIINNIFELLQNHCQHYLRNNGFFEDEHIGLAHTAINYNDRIPILKQEPLSNTTPCIICGNGPSLDQLLPIIKAHQSHALIVSCGTTLGTLLTMGIVPDIHIEMERTDSTTQSLLSLQQPEVIQNILFIGLNTVPPETFALFHQKMMVMKGHDAGLELLRIHMDRYLKGLSYCNPTVTNTGLALMLALGFKSIFLAGVDLGMKQPKKHHAKASSYYDKTNALFSTFNVEHGSIKVAGNFVDEVYTTPTLSSSSITMAMLLEQYPDTAVYNLSDGAKIQRAHPLPPSQLHHHLNQNLIKHHTLSSLLKHTISHAYKPLTHACMQRYLAPGYQALKQAMLVEPLPNTLSQFYQAITAYRQRINKCIGKQPLVMCLVSSSLEFFCLNAFLSGLALAKHGRLTISTLHKINTIYTDFINRCYQLLLNEPLTSHQQLLRKKEGSTYATECIR